ncbi:MAG: ATP-binding cassette domain-containing protein [Phycisphaera sp.]|nr:ATP-binding cassette domain-containing protein [Phycisphaera sp.]
MVRLAGVSKSFGPLRVLDSVDLEFESGRATVVIGPSGTGKSVLLKHVVGLLKPDAGEVYFDGQRVDTMSESQLVEVRKQVGFLFQMGALFDSMNVGENVCFPLVQHTTMKPAEQARRCGEVLRMVGLSGFESKQTGSLSGGQRKRVALARAIVLKPKLVLYDEPTTGLDPIRSDLINELIVTLGRELGITSVVVTHDIASANKIADRIVMLYDGHIIADGNAQGISQSDNPIVQRFIRGQADESELATIRAGFPHSENPT